MTFDISYKNWRVKEIRSESILFEPFEALDGDYLLEVMAYNDGKRG